MTKKYKYEPFESFECWFDKCSRDYCRDEMIDPVNTALMAWDHQQQKITELEARMDSAMEVIEFYGGLNWGTDIPGTTTAIDPCDHEDKFSMSGGAIRVGGKRARQWLKNNQEGVGE